MLLYYFLNNPSFKYWYKLNLLRPSYSHIVFQVLNQFSVNLMKTLHSFKPATHYKINESKNFSKKFSFKKTLGQKLAMSFVTINMWLPTPSLKVHHSFVSFYFFNSQSNIGIYNLRKLLMV